MAVLWRNGNIDHFWTGTTWEGGDCDDLLYNAARLLVTRGHAKEAAYLAAFNFTLVDALSRFDDHSSVLLSVVPVEQYEYITAQIDEATWDLIAMTISEIGSLVRYVEAQLAQVKAPEDWKDDLGKALAVLGTNQGLFQSGVEQ